MYANKYESITGNIMLVMIPRKEKNKHWLIFQPLNQNCGNFKIFYVKYVVKKNGKVHPKTGHEGLKGE
jgi:hypothetical protein